MYQFEQALIENMTVMTVGFPLTPDDGQELLFLPHEPAIAAPDGLSIEALLSGNEDSAHDLILEQAAHGHIILPSSDDPTDVEHIPHDDDDDPIIVTGSDPTEPPPEPHEPDDTGGLGHSDFKGVGWRDGPYEACQDTSQMTPEEREDYEVAVEAAEIAREIQAMADRDNIEYGAIIYRDANGVITHGTLTPGTATSVQPSTVGMPDWGMALGIVHSHPAHLYNATMIGFRMVPTPYQDWSAFNATQSMIADSLQADHHYSNADAIARANEFVYFVYGAFGPSGTDRYSLNRFDDHDESRQATSTSNQLDHAERVNIDLGRCGS